MFHNAEGAGFEPADPVAEVGGLANRWFKPLTQPSIIVGLSGLEPEMTGPESVVLPLHHNPIKNWVLGQVRTDVNRLHKPAPKPLGHEHK